MVSFYTLGLTATTVSIDARLCNGAYCSFDQCFTCTPLSRRLQPQPGLTKSPLAQYIQILSRGPSQNVNEYNQ